MTVPIILKDKSTGHSVKVTKRGQLIVSPLEFSKFKQATADTDNVAATIVNPATNQCFVITAMVITANRSIGQNDATVVVYEASASNTLTEKEVIFNAEIPKNGSIIISPLNIVTGLGVWINGKTNDNTVFFNLSGYFIDF